MKYKPPWFATCVALIGLAWLSGCAPAVPDPIPELDAKMVENIRATAASGGGGGGPVQKADGWGTLKGTIRLSQAAPSPARLTIDKDPQFCGKFSSELVDESLLTGPGNGLRNVVVFLRFPKTEVHESYQESATAEVAFVNNHCRFEPHVCLVRTTQTLRVRNPDPVSHNTNIQSSLNQSPNILSAAGDSATLQLKQPVPQPFPVSCNIHPWMSARIMVLDHPYMALTNERGEFTMKNVPAGFELEFQLWHEAAPNGLSGDSQQINVDGRGRFKITVQKHDETKKKNVETKFELTVPISAVR